MRKINGLLLLDKPTGMSSNKALQITKRLFNAQKAGHTGSLDPLASGLLPICLGEATKISQYLLAADKSYLVTLRLGVRTATGDMEGEVVATREVPVISMAVLENHFTPFRGEIYQTPSMYSALKHNGQPLYKLARQGITIERESRPITVHQLKILNFTADTVQFELHCSKGTYVRTLVEDFGESLGCGAHVIALHRTQVGNFNSGQMISLDALQALRENLTVEDLDKFLLPMETALSHWPQLRVAESTAFYLRQGHPVVIPHAPVAGWVVILDKNDRFLGIGEVLEDGKVAPRRVMH